MNDKVRLDPIAIAQLEHDPNKYAKKVSIIDADIAIELNADDGDSVQVQPRVFDYSPSSGEEMDITACREIIVSGAGTLTIQFSIEPSGDNFITLSSYENNTPILPILARRLKVIGNVSRVLGRG